jgi:chemotaxis protein MotB
MARKKKHEEHENHERWLVSYADFITLLFAFFVVMYSLSAINEGRFRVLSESLAAAFRSTPKALDPIQLGQQSKPDLIASQQMQRQTFGGMDLRNAPIRLPPRPIQTMARGSEAGSAEGERGLGRVMKEIAGRIEQAMAPLIEKGLVSVRRYRYWIEIEIKTNILFASGSALLEKNALPVLHEVGEVLKDYTNRIQVEGFTDDVPIRNAVYPSNWELSAARAMSVVHMLARGGISPARLSAVGYGEFRPVADNDSEEGRARNRRVVLVVLSEEDNVQRLRDLQGEKEPEVSAQAEPAEEAPPPSSGGTQEAVPAAPSASIANGSASGAPAVAPPRINLPPIPPPPLATPQRMVPGTPARGG